MARGPNGVTVPNIPEVTLVAATSVALEATAAALDDSLSQAAFGKALLLADRKPASAMNPAIEWHPIEPMTSRADYSAFMLHRLHEFVTTDFALCAQWDGFVIDGAAWDPDFLRYDYIGAVWPQFADGHNVGNGGFSLRSKKLLQATRSLPYDGRTAEDVLIARTLRSRLEAEGIRFAPEAVARRFSFERTAPSGREFGFHGAFNLVDLRPPDQLSRLLKSLEPQVLNHNEHKELLRWALRKGYLKISFLLAERMLRQRLSKS